MKLFGKSQKQFQAYVGNLSAYNMVMNSLTNAIKNREHRNGNNKTPSSRQYRIQTSQL